MNDSYTCTNNDLDDGLSVEKILKAWEALEAKLPCLLYRTSKYVQQLNKDGEPFIVHLPPSDIWPEATEGLLVTHPDNLSYLKTVCRGRYRLEPLIAAKERADPPHGFYPGTPYPPVDSPIANPPQL